MTGMQFLHTRHCGLFNFLGNLMAGRIAYIWRASKPALGIRHNDQPFSPIVHTGLSECCSGCEQ
jgi:hypothetical protein